MYAKKRMFSLPLRLLWNRADMGWRRESANATVRCPVRPGTYSVQQTVELPKEIPKGEYYLPSRRSGDIADRGG